MLILTCIFLLFNFLRKKGRKSVSEKLFSVFRYKTTVLFFMIFELLR